MNKLFSFILFAVFATGCSLYKSNLRKTFENDSPGKVRTASFKSCAPIGSLQAWLETDFSNENRELLLSESNLEAWKSEQADGQIIVTAIYHQGSETSACTWNLANKQQWQSEKQSILTDIQNGPEVTNESLL